MTDDINTLIYNLINKLNLGNIIDEPVRVMGGLLNRMYKVNTTSGIYAVKHLNPEVMKRKNAKENHILPICDGSITSYVIEYNGECLLIREYKIGKNAIYGCSNVTNYKDKLVNNSIDYNDVLNNKNKENRNNIDEGLKALEDNISYLYEQGISEEYLRYAINTFINKKSNDSELVKKK